MKTIPALVLSMLFCTPLKAELLGVVDGRGARLSGHPTISIELGATWYTPQLQWFATRINVKPATGFLAYVDVAHMQGNELPVNPNRNANFSGTGLGGGLLFNLPKWFNRYDLAFKLAYHSAILDESSLSTAPRSDFELSQWSADVVFSPLDPFYESGVSWYASAGFSLTNARLKMRSQHDGVSRFVDYRTNAGVVIGVGVIKPSNKGQWYAGFKWLADEPLVGLGFRYKLR